MPDIQLTDNERKVLSYISRGVSKDTADNRIALFFKMSSNDVAGAVNSLRRQNLIVESRGISGVTVLTTNPLKVKSVMIDQSVVDLLKQGEAGGHASGFKRKTFSADVNTGEIRDASAPRKSVPPKKPSNDLGFDISE